MEMLVVEGSHRETAVEIKWKDEFISKIAMQYFY